MNISEIKQKLSSLTEVNFQLPDGNMVPEHFHVTEVGMISKNFIDCGGTIRNEKVASFQLWSSSDVDHRLKPEKLINIIELSEKQLGLEDLEIEVEYQPEQTSAYSIPQTIGKYGLEFYNGNFHLSSKQTDCLAKDNCGIPVEKQKISLADLSVNTKNTCTPGGGCC